MMALEAEKGGSPVLLIQAEAASRLGLIQASGCGAQMNANELEDLIVRATSDPSARSELVTALLDSRVAIPLDRGLENGALPGDFKPLTLNAQEGYPVIAIFTTPAKAAPWIKQQPIFQHALVTGFLWVLRITRPPFGIALNPGYKYSLALSPGEVEVLAEKARAAT